MSGLVERERGYLDGMATSLHENQRQLQVWSDHIVRRVRSLDDDSADAVKLREAMDCLAEAADKVADAKAKLRAVALGD